MCECCDSMFLLQIGQLTSAVALRGGLWRNCRGDIHELDVKTDCSGATLWWSRRSHTKSVGTRAVGGAGNHHRHNPVGIGSHHCSIGHTPAGIGTLSAGLRSLATMGSRRPAGIGGSSSLPAMPIVAQHRHNISSSSIGQPQDSINRQLARQPEAAATVGVLAFLSQKRHSKTWCKTSPLLRTSHCRRSACKQVACYHPS